MYFLVNLKNSHTRVLNWAICENIHPVELAQYWIFPYWASSTGRIFSRIAQLRTLALQLSWFNRGCATKVFPHELSKYKNRSNMAENFSMCHMLCRNVDNFEGGALLAHPAGKTLGLSAHWVIHRQGLAGSSVRMHSVKVNVMLPPLKTITVCLTHLYNLVNSTLWNSSESLPYCHGWLHYREK